MCRYIGRRVTGYFLGLTIITFREVAFLSQGLSTSRVICLARYHTTDAPTGIIGIPRSPGIPRIPVGIIGIPRSPGNQMNVTVHDGLSGIGTDIDPYVVSVGLEASIQ